MPNSQTILPTATRNLRDSQSIAPVWHTAGVLLLLAALIALSALLHRMGRVDHASHRTQSYLVILTAKWLITAFIWFGCRCEAFPFEPSAGEMVLSWRAVLRDLGLAEICLLDCGKHRFRNIRELIPARRRIKLCGTSSRREARRSRLYLLLR